VTTETDSKKITGSDPRVSKRTTKRWKAFWFSERRSPSREALERRPRPPRRAKHLLLSKGAATCGAAEETPNLSQQRDGDRECSTGTRGGALTQCASPSLGSVGLEGFLVASLAGGQRCTPLAGSFRLTAECFASSETDTPPTQENDKPREGRDDPMRVRILALEGVPVRRI